MAYKKVGPPPKGLPPLPRLKVRKPILSKSTNQCFVFMSSLLNCWASNGEANSVCSGFEAELKKCMETYKPAKEQISTINYHAARLYPKLRGKVHD
ncbi:mitochondrial 37S ribosomal protein mS37 [Lodderomyces beijingensis]|uniref:Small ribosomal subunit protein mS37 n=1 Tax=Lodderomyces beijingensis TaxID=1775926 RepID=A0ABP0ZUU4_9ASCO